jgi:hypothetical protein
LHLQLFFLYLNKKPSKNILLIMKFTLSLVVCFLVSVDSYSQVDPVGNFNRHVFEKWTGEYIRIEPIK